MRAIRQLSAWVLLTVLAVTVMPKEIWHVCEHATAEHHADQDGATVEAPCPICEQGATVATGATEIGLLLIATIDHPVMCPSVCGTSLGFTSMAADRGPPSVL